MTYFNRAFEFGRSLFADEFGGSQSYMALLMGLAASAH
jgi:hypothetical protein